MVEMSLSPKHAHSTPFSVTDILSPLEQEYKKNLEAAIQPLGQYHYPHGSYNQCSVSVGRGGGNYIPGNGNQNFSAHAHHTMTAMGNMPVPVTSPCYNVPQFAHPSSSLSAQYYGGHELTGYDPTGRHGSSVWYGSNHGESRFPCECNCQLSYVWTTCYFLRTQSYYEQYLGFIVVEENDVYANIQFYAYACNCCI